MTRTSSPPAAKVFQRAREMLRPVLHSDATRRGFTHDPIPVRHVFEVTDLRGGTYRVLCTITDDNAHIRVDLDAGQSWITRACGFEDDEERGEDWLIGEAIRSHLRKELSK
jgi:hypothetical protein